MTNPINCIECARRRAQLLSQLDYLRIKTQKKVNEDCTTYCIWLDEEDSTLHSTPIDRVRGKAVEYISKHT